MMAIRSAVGPGTPLPSATTIAVAILFLASELPAQQVSAARIAVGDTVRPAACEQPAGTNCRDATAGPWQNAEAHAFRPTGMAVGALVGALYGSLAYLAASEAGDQLLTFSDYRLPKAVAVGAAVGLLIDVARHFGADGAGDGPE